jgi:HTH-type transcriptional regulator/antitoxin HipB
MEVSMNQVIRSPKQLGSLLQNERLRQGLTQKGLAELSGIGQKTISHTENGRTGTKLETVFSLLAALGLELQLGARSKAPQSEIGGIF